MKDKGVRKSNKRTCLACSAWLSISLIKNLAKKGLDHGLVPRISTFFLEHLQFLTDVSNTCFKYFKKFHKKPSAVDYNVNVNLHIKSATLTKLYLKAVISLRNFCNFLKELFYLWTSSTPDAYLELSQKSMMELFCENSKSLTIFA